MSFFGIDTFSFSNLLIFTGVIYLLPILIIAILTKIIDINSIRLGVWRIPIISGLALSTWDNFFEVLKELSIKLFFSSWPILLSIAIFKTKQNNFDEAIKLSLQDGQLYLFCGSMLSSIAFVALNNKPSTTSDDDRDKHVFPNQTSHLLIVLVFLAISAFIYAFRKIDSNTSFSPEVMINLSYFYFMFVIGLNVVSSTISKALNSPNAYEFLRKGTKKFSDNYQPGKN